VEPTSIIEESGHDIERGTHNRTHSRREANLQLSKESPINMKDIPPPVTIESDTMLENRRKKYLKDLPTSALVPGDNKN
jgi:hypothetical protein